MLVAILKDKINNIDSYLYLKKRNNQYIYYGCNIENAGVSNIDKNIVTIFFDLFKINNNCVYIEDYNDYQVYYDQKNNYKHYIKDGKEDFLMFFLFNGIDATSYSMKRLKSRSEVKCFELKEKSLAVVISLTMCLVLELCSYGILDAVNESGYEINENLEFEIEQIDVDQALELITSSNNIDTDTKEFLCNEEFFYDVFSHYDNKMKYIISSKLENIAIKNFSQNEWPGVSGFYNPLEMNNLYILDSIEDKSDSWYNVLSHEYVHLFQSGNMKFLYIIEGSAELISNEYFNNNIDSYYETVLNLKLLIETVGPEVIWDLNFKNDESELIGILSNNLSFDDYNKLYNYLTLSPYYDNESINHQEIRNLIYKLYKNMYGIEMKDDYNIYDVEGNYIEKSAYFNQDKMCEVIYGYSIEEAEKIGLIKTDVFYRYEKEINKSEFDSFIKNHVNEKDSKLEDVYVYSEVCEDYIVNNKRQFLIHVSRKRDQISFYFSEGDKMTLNVKEALELGYIKNVKYYYTYDTKDFNDKKIKDMKKTDYSYDVYHSTLDNYEIFGGNYLLYIPTIQDKFPDQNIRKNNTEKTSTL